MQVSKEFFVEVYMTALRVHVGGPRGSMKIVEMPHDADYQFLLWRLEQAYEFNEKTKMFRPFVQFRLCDGFVQITYSSPTAYQACHGVTHDMVSDRILKMTNISQPTKRPRGHNSVAFSSSLGS